MKPNHRLPIIAICLFLQACASPPPVIEQTSLDTAATQILAEGIYFSTIFSRCAELGGDIEIEAISKQQDWLNTNSKLLLAADQLYSQQQATNTFDFQGKTLAPAAIKLAIDARQRANSELALQQRTPINKVKTCEFRLGKITAASLNLAQAPALAPYAGEVLKHLPLDEKMNDIPSLAGGIREVAPGPTYFTLVKAHATNCTNAAFTLSIVNQWPREVYANFCGDKAVEVQTCEWGKCEAKSL